MIRNATNEQLLDSFAATCINGTKTASHHAVRDELLRRLNVYSQEECDHDFPEQQDFCTHLGHSTLGSHSRHYVCRSCGALKTVELSRIDTRIMPAKDAVRLIYLWDIIRTEHQCTAGWKGTQTANIKSTQEIQPLDLTPVFDKHFENRT